MNSKGSFIRPNSNKMGQITKICSQALLFCQLHKFEGCIFQQRDEKPAMKWSFCKNGSGRFRVILSKSQAVWDWSKSLGNWCFEIQTGVAVQVVNARSWIPTYGRIFLIDTDENFQIAMPLLQDKHELIGKFSHGKIDLGKSHMSKCSYKIYSLIYFWVDRGFRRSTEDRA